MVGGSCSIPKLPLQWLDMISLEDLQNPGVGIHLTAVAPGPVIGIVMLVHPQQHIDIARVGLQHDAAVILIDAHRAKMAVTGGIGRASCREREMMTKIG